ncbi:MAG: ATP-binding protein [Tepidisphaerales bacterium]
MLTLLVLQGPDKGRKFELPEEELVIGRGAAHIPLTDNTVSRRHAQITPREGLYLLSDLGSANGTYINGLRVTAPQAIRVGDQLRVGRTLMVFGTAPKLGGIADDDVEIRGADAGMDSAIMHTLSPEDSMVLAVPEPSAAAMSNLQVLYRLAALLGSRFDVEQAMAITLDLVFEHLKAERGVIMLRAGPEESLVPVVVRTRDRRETAAAVVAEAQGVGRVPRIQASRTIIDHVLRSGEAVLSSNAMADRRFSKGQSVHDLGIRSALCVPIAARRMSGGGGAGGGAGGGGSGGGGSAGGGASELLGVIYIDSSVRNYTFSPDQLRLLSAIGLQAGLAVQNARLYQAGLKAERLAAIGETTAALSHSIKNILQALRGGADVVEMGLSGGNLDQARKGWAVVSRNLDRIYSLTLNLLAYSRPRVPEFAPVDMGRVVADVAELVSAAARDRRVRVETHIEPGLPLCEADADGVHQLLMNLVGNAIDAVNEGAGVVRVIARSETADVARAAAAGEHGGWMVLEVEDNGPGIPETMRQHLFELFHSTKGNRGTGLGLAVSRKIAEEHGGRIDVVSTTGHGTRFTVRLPLRRMAVGDDVEA